jgi:hypothetical protein
MRDLYSRLASTGRPLTNDELSASVERAAGKDFSDFFRDHVTGIERIPTLDYLQHIGIEQKDGSGLRIAESAAPARAASRAAYLGPRATYDGAVPAWALRGHDPDVSGGRFEPAGRYDVVLQRAEGDVALEIMIVDGGGRLSAIVNGPGGTIAADDVTVAGTHIGLGFTAHGTPIRLELDARLEGVEGTWSIQGATGKAKGRKAPRGS